MEKKRGTGEEKKMGLGFRLLCNPEFGIMIPVVLMCAVTAVLSPNFIRWGNISYLIEQGIFVGYLALGEALIIMNGEIDLSIGLSGGLATVMTGIATTAWGLPMPLAMLVGVLTGVAVGAVNGFITAVLGLTSWITTLATQFICQGLAAYISNGVTMRLTNEAYAAQYDWLRNFKSWTIPKLGFSTLFIIFVVILVLLDIVVRKTKFGYRLKAVGGNRDAALLSGINVKKNKFMVFTIGGLFAGLYGVMYAVYNMSTSLSQGSGGEFRAITCCAIGGIVMSGGKGSIYGVGLGVLLFHIVNGALQSLKANNNVQLMMVGVLLVMAVLLDIVRQRIETRKVV